MSSLSSWHDNKRRNASRYIYWSEEEDQIIRENVSKTAREIQKFLPGKSLNAINSRRLRIKWGLVEDNDD